MDHNTGYLILLILSFLFVTSFGASCLTTTSLQLSSSLQRTLRGPGYPFNYPNNALYCWRIYAPTGYVVKLTISSLNMEVCSGCSCDSIQIFNGYSEFSSSLGKFCSGSWKITSSGRYLYLKFTSDATGTGTPFTVYYYRTKTATGGGFNYGGGSNNNRDHDDNNKSTLTIGIGGGVGGFFSLIFFCCIYYWCCGGG